MSKELLYLKPNVVVEPLFDSWYAWSHLIPPANAARNITERYFKIMESYISAPQVHAAAVKNPKMLGGPFIDYNGQRVHEVSALLERTKHESAPLIALSSAIQALDKLLAANAKGFSLSPLYAQVPEALRGYVELVYDLNNNASFRILEPLLYRSKYYRRSSQSLRFSLIHDDARPFALSTPRLQSPDSIDLPVPFDDPLVDELFHLKRIPAPWSEIPNLLTVPANERALLRSFFDVTPPRPYEAYAGNGVRWRYFGHACILLETKDLAILFDPVLSYTYESGISRYTYEDLPEKIDLVLITHNHQDHILFETLLQIRNRVRRFVVPGSGGGTLQDPSMKLILEHAGCDNVLELRDLESIALEGGSITAVPFLGEHCDLDIRSKSGYLVRLGANSLLFLADSCNLEPALYKHISHELDEVDALFLGMECDGAPLSWLYGPLVTNTLPRAMDASRRLAGSDYQQAIDIVESFHCKQVYVYAMGQEPWLNYVMSIKYTDLSRPILESNRLIAECRSRGIHAERLFGEKEILLEDRVRHGVCS
jgi:L-ascorbate metabolism protein UlaG (beta-lactamase superfamily)